MCPKLRYSHHTKQQGIGLPVALFVITVLALIVVALTDLEESSGVSFSLDVNSMRAFYAAESGAQVGLNSLFPPGGGPGSACANVSFNSVVGLSGCSASVSCTNVTVDAITYYTISSTGQCGAGLDMAERVIEVRARQ